MNNERYEELRKSIDRGFDTAFPEFSVHNIQIGLLGVVCSICGEKFDYPTRLNRIDNNDKNGNLWARTNAVSQATRHVVEKSHSKVGYRKNGNKAPYEKQL